VADALPVDVARPRRAGLLRVRSSSVLLGLLVVVVVVLNVTPVAAALVTVFRDAPPGRPGTFSLDAVQAFLGTATEPQTLQILWTTLWLAVVRAVLATALAIVVAWILARTDCPFRDRLEFLVILAFFFPVLGKVLGWSLLLSPQQGYINQLLRWLPFVGGERGPLDVYSYGGLIFVSILGWSTWLIIFLLPAFRAMDASLEESARVCGASAHRAVLRIVVPLLRPAILAAFLLAVTRLLSSFETEVFLGTPAGIFVLTNKIYERLGHVFPPDFATGMTLSLLLLVVTFALVGVYWRLIGNRDYTTVSGRGYSARPMALGKLRWVAFAVVLLYILVALVLPVGMLIQTSFARVVGVNMLDPAGYTLDNWRRMLSINLNQLAVRNSVIMSVVATTLGMMLYAVVAYVVTRTRYKGRHILDLAAWVPWAVPTLVLGLGILWAVLLSPLAALYGTLAIMILAHLVRGFPVGTRIMASTMVQISKELEESARIHRATWPRAFWRIWLPLVKNGYVAGWVMGFTVAFSDLATVAFLYGSQSMVLPTLFLSQWQNGQLELASVAALMMTAVILAVVVVVRRLTQTGLLARTTS
jgi:iron(III) transport system permease protein